MGWTKVSDRRWERPMDGLESYFAITGTITGSLCGGREHYMLFSRLSLELESPDPEVALRRAWVQMRHQQPQLAVTVDGVDKVYEVPDEAGLEKWLADTFIVSGAADSAELHQHVTDKPLHQATLYYLPRTSELVFRAHHHNIDGTGVLLFWDCYLGALASPAEHVLFGEEHTRLVPAMGDILGFPDEATQDKNDKANEILMSWLSNIPGVGPVSKVGSAPAGKCQNIEMVLPAKTTTALIRACKEKGVTVTSAVHAAYIAAMAKHASPDSKTSEYVSMTQFNLRPYLPEPYGSASKAVSVFYTPFPYRIGLPVSFWDSARSLHGYYKTTFKSNPELLELKDLYMRTVCSVIQTPEFLTSPVPRDALFSSLGIAERYMQREYGSKVKVRDMQMSVDVVLGMSMVFLYTFQDQLRLVYNFNDGYEEPKDIQTYLDEVQKILFEELLA
ncbi:hypothetical protein ACRE_089880 [Hapsidospora chrysogenum ATCC 11550]|uniref:Condensation domain-containing protein n=1 Tax=Hapsidospora chrysogenum (strain ATCC 11550 / CBS 779.69 / DSM 880 / IAM 14645 / JCM 23072 / IMI 49137) TaxID=857340 RepID=A0A086STB2_HAPC1|nr:hypothetical protein ACRE_089880 [Hapsidospora chrysogenum ATCC 11550]